MLTKLAKKPQYGWIPWYLGKRLQSWF